MQPPGQTRDDRVSCIQDFESLVSQYITVIYIELMILSSRLTLYIGDLSTKNLENRLPFELQCWSTTHFQGFVELSALPLHFERFGGNNMVYLALMDFGLLYN